ncbi:small integral membrane protein 35 [Pogoniulus pusillus]|uniref:small integral membrane protein 35 n=1 Tax=Pogoniulus pusillus TaxID=488313 RepID=UPI0030B9AA21
MPGSSTHPALLQLPPSSCGTALGMDPRAGQESFSVLGTALAAGLGLLILLLLGYTFVRWCQRGQCCRDPDFVFSLYHTRGLGAVAVELVPPFSISGALSGADKGYEPFHSQGH